MPKKKITSKNASLSTLPSWCCKWLFTASQTELAELSRVMRDSEALPTASAHSLVTGWLERAAQHRDYAQKHGFHLTEPQPTIVLDTPTKLRQQCERWQMFWQQWHEGKYVPKDTIADLWGVLRKLAKEHDATYPPLPTAPTNLREGIGQLDFLIGWCAEQERGSPPGIKTTEPGVIAPVKGKPGRRGYPLEVLQYAHKLRQKHPTMKVHTIRQKCLERYSVDDMPLDTDSFRTWLNRKRTNRTK
jgi:hypothetical protein